jgi:ABC-2 type transport system ATP-binding protein
MSIAQIGWFTSGFQGDGYLDRYLELVRQFSLDQKARLSVLSKGQYAKVGLALALAVNPEVLILDEPTSGLDLLVRREFLASMVRLAGEGRTILICSHQVAEIERIASHVAFLHAGRVLLTAPLENLRELMVRVRLRCDPPFPPLLRGGEHGSRPDGSLLGTVLQEQRIGGKWQVILREPDRAALDRLRVTPGIHDYEEAPLGLEEIYCALFAREASAV